jgi:hypothetical protein
MNNNKKNKNKIIFSPLSRGLFQIEITDVTKWVKFFIFGLLQGPDNDYLWKLL